MALLPDHVEHFNLPRSLDAKANDPRAKAFRARHGGLWQTELDALDPDDLRELFVQAFLDLWDMSVYRNVLGAEQALLDAVLAR